MYNDEIRELIVESYECGDISLEEANILMEATESMYYEVTRKEIAQGEDGEYITKKELQKAANKEAKRIQKEKSKKRAQIALAATLAGAGGIAVGSSVLKGMKYTNPSMRKEWEREMMKREKQQTKDVRLLTNVVKGGKKIYDIAKDKDFKDEYEDLQRRAGETPKSDIRKQKIENIKKELQTFLSKDNKQLKSLKEKLRSKKSGSEDDTD